MPIAAIAKFATDDAPLPVSGVSIPADLPYDVLKAGVRAYNRWLADFCAANPDRHVGIALVPPADDVQAVVDRIAVKTELWLAERGHGPEDEPDTDADDAQERDWCMNRRGLDDQPFGTSDSLCLQPRDPLNDRTSEASASSPEVQDAVSSPKLAGV